MALSQQEWTLPWGRPMSSEGGQGKQSQYWSLLAGFSLKPVTALSEHSNKSHSMGKAPECP